MAINKALFKFIYKAHVYAGIFIAFHLSIFAITGLALLFKDEIQGHEVSTSFNPSPTELASLYQRALQDAQLKHPNDLPLAAFPEDDNAHILNLRLGIDGSTQLRGSRRLAYDLTTGQEISKTENKANGFFDTMLLLHRELFLGSNGKIYVGLVGLIYVFMLVSGFFIYGRFMKGRTFAEIRTRALPRTIDLHKFAGILTFAWGFVVALSGVFLAFNGVLIKLFQYQSLKHLSSRYRELTGEATQKIVSIDQVIQATLAAKPDKVVTYVSFPNTEFGIPGHHLVLVNGTDTFSQRISELVVVGSQAADLKEIVELPLYLKLVLLSEPLHFGDYGGLFLKVIWAIFTVGSLAVAVFGVTSFFLKRQQRRHPKKAASIPSSNSVARFRLPGALGKSTYFVPVVLAITSIAGLVGALVLDGALGAIATALLVLPFAGFFLLHRSQHG